MNSATTTTTTSAAPSSMSTLKTNMYHPKTRCERALQYSGYTGSALGGVAAFMADKALSRSNPKYANLAVPARVAMAASVVFASYYVATNAAFYFCPYRSDIPATKRDLDMRSPLNQARPTGQHM